MSASRESRATDRAGGGTFDLGFDDVEADGASLLAELDDQGQADIAQTDHGNGRRVDPRLCTIRHHLPRLPRASHTVRA